MRKFLSVIALGVITAALILVGIICATRLGKLTENANLLTDHCTELALCIGGFLGGIGTGIATIANLFTAKTRDKN